MLEPVKHRGPDGVTSKVFEHMALGHASLATTPEATRETLPLCHAETGCWIVADARLDYREELEKKLGLSSSERSVGDGELILLSYLKWRTDSLQHLEGDFAFVIFDPRDNRLFCARDPIGMRRLSYHHRPGSLFAFATEPLAIAAHPDIPAELNPERIGDFLEGQEAYDLTSTFFRHVHRLPPAHAMVVDAGGLKSWRYWELERLEPLILPSNDDYADALREALMQAVETRLRASTPVGSMLSGGMDSTSICALASHILARNGQPPLVTISAKTLDPDCVESATIQIAQGLENITPRSVLLEEPEAYRSGLARRLETLDDPFDGEMVALRAIYADAQKAGLKVLLDGACGDTTLGPQDLPLWHIRRGRLFAAWHEISGERWVYRLGDSVLTEMRRKVLTAILPDPINQMRLRRARNRTADDWGKQSVLDQDFAQSIDMAERRKTYIQTLNAHLNSPLGDRAAKMLHASAATGRERYDRTAGAFGIEPRDPFTDTRLMQLVMQFPIEQFRDQGWHKVALRRAMKGWLPDAIRWRRGKEHIGNLFNREFQFDGAHENFEIFEQLEPYVNSRVLTSATERLKQGAQTQSEAKLYHLALWLRHVKRRTTQKDQS